MIIIPLFLFILWYTGILKIFGMIAVVFCSLFFGSCGGDREWRRPKYKCCPNCECKDDEKCEAEAPSAIPKETKKEETGVTIEAGSSDVSPAAEAHDGELLHAGGW